MRTIAVIGAAGFVGTRLIELFYLGGVAQVRPVVRSFKSLARSSRFELDCRMADARDEAALTKAFEGCDAVVNAAVGDDRINRRDYRARVEGLCGGARAAASLSELRFGSRSGTSSGDG